MKNVRFFTLENVNRKIISTLIIFVMIISILLIAIPQSFAATYNQTTINANANNNNGIDAFPQSYKNLLNTLVSQTGHSNWKFKAFYTDIDWSELTSTSNENRCLTNTIYKGNPSSWYCTCGRQGDSGYYCASGKIVNYYLDPRNFLTETTIFQFADLSNASKLSVSDIQKVVAGSFMEGNTGNGDSYAEILYAASEASGENAISIVSKIFQEIGKGSPGNPPYMVSGKDATYPNTYNFFNYGASDGAGNIKRGLEFAYNKGWNNPRTALIEGAKLVAGTYISAGQNTKYTFKFDVVGSEKNQLYTHQYMTNLQDPNSQAKILFDKYLNNGWLNQELTFVIPVYKNMPASVKLPPAITNGDVYYVSSNYNSVGLRSGPGTGYARTDLKKDTTVIMLQKNAGNSDSINWDKVQLEDGTVGYISSEYMTKVNTNKDDYNVPSQPGDEGGTVTPPTASEGKYKIEADCIYITPSTTIRTLKNGGLKVTSATVDGASIGDDNVLPTTAVVQIDGKLYNIVKIGDVNGDGKINSADLLAVRKHLLGDKIIDSQYKKSAADANGDNKINSADLLKIQKYLLGVSDIEI